MNVPNIYRPEVEPGFMERLTEVTEDPTISMVAFAILGLAVTYYFTPISAVIMASTCLVLTIGAVAFYILLESSNKEVWRVPTPATTEYASDTDSSTSESENDDFDDKAIHQPRVVDVGSDDDIDDKVIPPTLTDNDDPVGSDDDVDDKVASPQFEGRVDQVKIGLPNTGNTCWLNACLKFIACSDYFDSILDTPLQNEKEPLRIALFNAVAALRSGNSGVLDLDIYSQLKEQIVLHMPDHMCDGRQRDAADFMRDLADVLNFKPADGFKGKIVYDSNSGATLTPREMDPCWYLPLKFETSTRLKKSMPLSALATKSAKVNARPENSDITTEFTATPHYYHLPNDLIIHLDRAAWNDQQQRIKVETLIRTKQNGIIELIEETCENSVFKPKRIIQYQIRSAIVHYGTTEGGHYVCHTRSEGKETFLSHDDKHIYPIRPNHFGIEGYFIHLRKYAETIIHEQEN